MSERVGLIKELFKKEYWRDPLDKKEFLIYLSAKRKEFSELLNVVGYKYNWNNIDWIGFVADCREKFNMPKYVKLEDFITFVQYIMVSKDKLNYDKFLKLVTDRKLKKSCNLKSPKIEKLIKFQWSRLAQWLVEIVANSIDATNPSKSIWRFGEWFFQSLKYLENWWTKLSVDSCAKGKTPIKIDIKHQWSDLLISTAISEKSQTWTRVKLEKPLTKDDIDYLISYISSIFKTNSRVNILVNWEQINQLEQYYYINKIKLDCSNLKSIFINIDENWFEVIDHWTGMDSQVVCEKLLYPTASTKKKINPVWEELEEKVEEDTKFFYKSGKFNRAKTKIRLQVSGVMIEEFSEDSVWSVEEFTLELPSFTWLPESRNQIYPTREIAVAIAKSLDKINKKVNSLQEKIQLAQIIWKIISKLKERPTDETEKKYTLEYISKHWFHPILEQITLSGKVAVPWIKQLIDIFSSRDDLVFLHEDFVDLDFSKIPWVQKLDNIENPKVSFYEVEFSEKAEFDYLITKKWVLVNSKFTKDPLSMSILNTSINLNVSYEINKVFYGRIVNPKPKSEKTDSSKSVKTSLKKEKDENLLKNFILRIDDLRSSFPEVFEYIENDSYYAFPFEDRIKKWLKDYDLSIPDLMDEKDLLFFCIFMSKYDSLRRPSFKQSPWYDDFKTILWEFMSKKSSKIINMLLSFFKQYFLNIPLKVLMNKNVFVWLGKIIQLIEAEPEYMKDILVRLSQNYYWKSWYFLFPELDDILNECKKEQEKQEAELIESIIWEEEFINRLVSYLHGSFNNLEDDVEITLSSDERFCLLNDLRKKWFTIDYFKKKLNNVFFTIKNGSHKSFYDYLIKYSIFAEKEELISIFTKDYNSFSPLVFSFAEKEKILSVFKKRYQILIVEKRDRSCFIKEFKSWDFIPFLEKFVSNRTHPKESETDLFWYEWEGEFIWDLSAVKYRDISIDIKGFLETKIIKQFVSGNTSYYYAFYNMLDILKIIKIEDLNLLFDYFSTRESTIEESLNKWNFYENEEEFIDFFLRRWIEDNFKLYWKDNYEFFYLLYQFAKCFGKELVVELSKKIQNKKYEKNETKEVVWEIEFIDKFLAEYFEINENNLFLKTKEDKELFEHTISIDLRNKIMSIHPVFSLFKSENIYGSLLDFNFIQEKNIDKDFSDFGFKRNFSTSFRKIPLRSYSRKETNLYKNLVWFYEQIQSKKNLGNSEQWEELLSKLKEYYHKLVVDRQTKLEKEDRDFFLQDFKQWSLGNLFSVLKNARWDWYNPIGLQIKAQDRNFDIRQILEAMKFDENWRDLQSTFSTAAFVLSNDDERSLISKFQQIEAIETFWETIKYDSDIYYFLYQFAKYHRKTFMWEKISNSSKDSTSDNEEISSNNETNNIISQESFVNQLARNLVWEEVEKSFLLEDVSYFFFSDLSSIGVKNSIKFVDELEKILKEIQFLAPPDNSFYGYLRQDHWSSNFGWLWVSRESVNLVFEKYYQRLIIDKNKKLEDIDRKIFLDEYESCRLESFFVNFAKRWKWDLFLWDDQIVPYTKENSIDMWKFTNLLNLCTYHFFNIRWEDFYKDLAIFMIEMEIGDIELIFDFFDKYDDIPSQSSFFYIELPNITDLSSVKDPFNCAYFVYQFAKYFRQELTKDSCENLDSVVENRKEKDSYSLPQLFVEDIDSGAFHSFLSAFSTQRNSDAYSWNLEKVKYRNSHINLFWFLSTNIIKEYRLSPFSYEKIWKSLSHFVLDKTSKDLDNIYKYFSWFDEEIELSFDKNTFNSYEEWFNNFFWSQGYFRIAYLTYTLLKYLIEEKIDYKLKSFVEEKKVIKRKSINMELERINSYIASSLFPQDLVYFVLFVLNWGEFLKSKDSKIEIDPRSYSFNLTSLICANRFLQKDFAQVTDIDSLQNMFENFALQSFDTSIFAREIFSTIEWQDKSSMVWLRELTQNSRDAILKDWNSSKKIDFEFYNVAWAWACCAQDSVGMSVYEVFNYLLTPWESSKWKDASVWMFGQWFYSLAVWAKEIKLKTSNWNWHVLYLKMIPIYNDQDSIIDFDINIEIKKEQFKWTLIERLDSSSIIWWNIRAMIWLNNMQKYVWNVSDVDIIYNWNTINNKNLILVDQVEVPWFGVMKLHETKDNIERLTKDNLYISSIPDDFISDLPEWMVEVIRSHKLSLDLPAGVPLTKTRNSITDYESNLKLLKPYIYTMCLRYVLNINTTSWVSIPMMPEDYFALLEYERRIQRKFWNYKNIIDKINNFWELTQQETIFLKDKENMALILIYIKFNYRWKNTTLSEIKKEYYEKSFNIRNDALWNMLNHVSTYQGALNTTMADNTIKDVTIDEAASSLQISKKDLISFKKKIEKLFKPLVKKVFGKYFAGKTFDFEVWFCKRNMYNWFWWFDYGIRWNTVFFNWNIKDYKLKSIILNYDDPKKFEYEILDLLTHEFTHLVEWDKWSTHEKDLEHPKSFEKIQRDLLRELLRIDR